MPVKAKNSFAVFKTLLPPRISLQKRFCAAVFLEREIRRDGRAAEGTFLLRRYTGKTVSRVRIPFSPPAFALASFDWQASLLVGLLDRRLLERRLRAIANRSKSEDVATAGCSNIFQISSKFPPKSFPKHLPTSPLKNCDQKILNFLFKFK